MKRTLSVIILVCVVALLTAATSLELRPAFPAIKTEANVSVIELAGGQLYGEPGDPALPWLGTKILLPVGEEAVSISVKLAQPQIYTLDKPLKPIPAQYPFSQTDLPAPVGPNPAIYGSDTVWPTQPHNGVNTHFLTGHPINFSAVCPFEYYPARHELIFYASVTVTVESAPSAKSTAALELLKQNEFTTQSLKNAINNQDALPRYQTRTSGVEYLIIIDSAKYDQWLPLADFYSQRGLNVMMKPVQEILSQTAGQDSQDKIRNYIIQMYQTNSLRYVLLAADTDMIPHRGFYVNFTGGQQTDADIPADMYYACLDGNWNNDGDANWGEQYEADLAPELALGRICYNNDTEIANQINKIMMYHVAPVEAETKTAFFTGEWLWDGPTWGGDYMDEMIGGASTHGYTTVGVPTSWNISTLYDRTYGYSEAWGPSEIRPMLSQGANLVNHLGHSNTTYAMRLSNNQVTATSISNNGANHNFSLYFTQGCYAGAFDNRNTNPGSYTTDCIAEKFTGIATSAASMIAHSRYGWGMQGSTDGASQYLHRQYIDAIFGENIHDLGFTLVDSKIDNIPFITNQPVMYWVTYETNLIGDPALSVWSDTPQQIVAQMPPMWSMSILGYQIPTNAPYANLRIKSGSTIIFEGSADASGQVYVSFLQGLTPGQYELYITAPNFYPYQNLINVQASQMPYVVAINATHNDADGLLHTGENVNLSFVLKNLGSLDQTASGTVTLTCASPNIQVLSDPISFNAIAAGDSIVITDAFQIGIRGNYEDGSTVTLSFVTDFDGYSSTNTQLLTLNAPNLAITSYQFVNPTPIIYPGQTPSISISLANQGSGNAYTPFMILFCDTPSVNLSNFEVTLPPVPAEGQSTATAAFSAQIPETLELGSNITIGYILSAENGPSVEGNLIIHLGMLSYSFEADMLGWDSSAPNPGFVNQWHRSTYRNNTPGGSYSMKFGGSGSGQYGNSALGALDSPEFMLGMNSMLKFSHWMDAEAHSTPTYAWDGGLVQMSIDGGEWIQISPVGGYTHRIYQNNASPFAANTNCWSGSFAWTEATFDLSSYSGNARFRFLFGTDGAVTGEGWYVDDIRVESEFVDNSDPAVSPLRFDLNANYPNPFNPSTTISFSVPASGEVELAIFNLKGQRVKTLVSGELTKGQHSVVWNGLDNAGRSVASGVYLYKLRSGTELKTRKMMLMK